MQIDFLFVEIGLRLILTLYLVHHFKALRSELTRNDCNLLEIIESQRTHLVCLLWILTQIVEAGTVKHFLLPEVLQRATHQMLFRCFFCEKFLVLIDVVIGLL